MSLLLLWGDEHDPTERARPLRITVAGPRPGVKRHDTPGCRPTGRCSSITPVSSRPATEDDRVAFPSTRSEKLRAAPGEPLASRRWFKHSQRLLGRDWPTAYLFIALTVLLLGLVKAYPLLQAIWFSFHRVIGFRMGDFVGLENYVLLWGDDQFIRSVRTTITFTFFSEVFKLAL